MAALNLTTSNGSAIELEVGEYLDSPRLVKIKVGDRSFGSANGEVYSPPDGAPRGVAGFIATRGARIGLTAESCATLQAAIENKKSEIESRQEVMARRLRAQRSKLAEDCQTDELAGELAWERGDEDAWARARATDRKRVKVARRALADFDAAHPEVVEEIRREQADAAARNAWN